MTKTVFPLSNRRTNGQSELRTQSGRFQLSHFNFPDDHSAVKFFLESDSPERGLSRTLRSQPPPKFPPQGPGPRPRIAKKTFEMVNEDRGKRSRGKTIAKEVLQEAPSASLTFSTPADVAGKCVFPEGNANRSGVARGGKRTGEPIAEAAPKRPTIEWEPKDNQSEVGKKKEELK